MAIDLSKSAQDAPNDPLAVKTIAPQTVDAYLPAGEGDWSRYVIDDPAEASKQGLTRRVSVSLATLNNGEQYYVVRDAKGTPILNQPLGDRIGIDTKQQDAFKGQQSTTKAPNGQQYSRGPDGTISEWNPASNPPGYNIPHPEMSPAGAIRSPEAKANDEALQAQRQKNASLPAGQDPMYETDAERAKRAEDRIRQQGIDANTAADNRRADEAAAQAAAVRNRPTVTIKDDGSGGLVAISTDPTTGKATTSPIPGVKGQPQQVTAGGAVYEKGPDGTYKPAAGIPLPGNPFTTPDSPDAPPLGTTREDIVRGYQTYGAYIAGQVKLYQDTNGKQGVSPADGYAKMEQRAKVGDAVIASLESGISNQTSLRGQDITERGQTIQDATARRSAATGVYNQTLSSFLPQIKYLAPGKGANMAAAMQATLDGGLAYANAWGGQQEAPPVGYGGFPGLDAIRANTAAALAPPAPAPQQQFNPAAAAGAPPATPPAPALPPQPPVPAGAMPAPAGPPAPAVNPVSQAPIPAPSVPSLSPARPDQTQVGSQIDNAIMPPAAGGSPPASPIPSDGSPGYAPPMPQMADPTASDPNYQQPQYPPPTYVIHQGDPSHPQYPSQEIQDMTPGSVVQVPGEATGVGVPYPNPAGAVSMTPRFLQQARYGQAFDPHAAAGELAARLGIPPEIMQQAVAGQYG